MTLVIPTATNFNPGRFFGQRWWSVVASETDRRAEALTEVDFAAVNLETHVGAGFFITGEEKLRRMRVSGDIILGASIFRALWKERGRRTLNWLRKERGIIYVDFMGTILLNQWGNRGVLSVESISDGSWIGSYRTLDSRSWFKRSCSASLPVGKKTVSRSSASD